MVPVSHTSVRPDTSDPARLDELDALDILDTVPEESFDDAAQIARLVCQTPVALISLVAADRQWFKARVGFQASETDLSRSVCVYALHEPDLLIIPDLAADPRTRSNPLVTGEPHIRFYAGAPLRTERGRALGSLCVIDHQPRPDGLSDEQQDALRRLSRQIMILLRERRQMAKMQVAEVLAMAAATRRMALIELGDHLRDLSTIPEMTAKAAEIVGRTLNASRAGYGEVDGACQIITIPRDWTAPDGTSVVGRHHFSTYGTFGPALERGETLAIPDVTADSRTAGHAERFVALNIRAQVNVPVREAGRTVGVLFVHSPQVRTWAPEEIAFARNVADRVQVGIGRLRAEEQQVLLNRELSHRMKNTLAMVQAIAAQTIRTAPDLTSAGTALSARLIAMGRAHDILLSGTSEHTNLEAVVRAALAIHDDAQLGRLRLRGPLVRVGSKAALSLALVLHELATNASKYGALSTSEGHVSVDWVIEAKGAEPSVQIRWIEQGGPRVVPPKQRGFGSRLIERGLSGIISASVRLAYPPEGAICELTANLADFQSDE